MQTSFLNVLSAGSEASVNTLENASLSALVAARPQVELVTQTLSQAGWSRTDDQYRYGQDGIHKTKLLQELRAFENVLKADPQQSAASIRTRAIRLGQTLRLRDDTQSELQSLLLRAILEAQAVAQSGEASPSAVGDKVITGAIATYNNVLRALSVRPDFKGELYGDPTWSPVEVRATLAYYKAKEAPDAPTFRDNRPFASTFNDSAYRLSDFAKTSMFGLLGTSALFSSFVSTENIAYISFAALFTTFGAQWFRIGHLDPLALKRAHSLQAAYPIDAAKAYEKAGLLLSAAALYWKIADKGMDTVTATATAFEQSADLFEQASLRMSAAAARFEAAQQWRKNCADAKATDAFLTAASLVEKEGKKNFSLKLLARHLRGLAIAAHLTDRQMVLETIAKNEIALAEEKEGAGAWVLAAYLYWDAARNLREIGSTDYYETIQKARRAARRTDKKDAVSVSVEDAGMEGAAATY